MFQVFEGCRGLAGVKDYELPADKTGFAWATTWGNSKFATWAEAVAYANHWVGHYAQELSRWEVNKEYHYYDESYMVIREIKEEKNGS